MSGNPVPYPLIDAIPALIWQTRGEGSAGYLNRAWRAYTGMGECADQDWEWLDAVHPDHRTRFLEAWHSARATDLPDELEIPLRGSDGVYRWFLARMVPRATEMAEERQWLVSFADIEERKGVETLLAGKNRLLEMLAKGELLPAILDELCGLVERMFPGSFSAVFLIENGGRMLRKGAAPSMPEPIQRFFSQGVPVEENAGPCGRTAHRREAQIVGDIATYGGNAAFRELLETHFLRAAWSMPIISPSSNFLGTLALFRRIPGEPDAQQLERIDQITHLGAVAIEQSRAAERLRRSEAHLATAQRITMTGSFHWDATSGEMTWSAETFRICEIHPSVTPTPEMTRDLFHPEDLHHFRAMVAGAKRDYHFEARLNLVSGIKHIEVVGVAERDHFGRLSEWTGTFMDITERRRTADALRASEHLAREQVEALGEALALMSRESDPERFLNHVLRMICRRLGTRRLDVWEISGSALEQVAVCENDQVRLTAGEEGNQPFRMDAPPADHPVWAEFLREGRRVMRGELSPRQGSLCFADEVEMAWPGRQDTFGAPGADSEGGYTLHVPMVIAGRTGAMISIRLEGRRIFDRGELGLAHALARQATLALQLGRLSRQSKQMAVLAERNRLARDIHDTLAQSLTGIVIQLRAARDATGRGLLAEADNHLLHAGELAGDGLREARRSVRALRTVSSKPIDLIRNLEEMFARMTADTLLATRISVHGRSCRLDADAEADVIKVSQEILTNALKHANAKWFRLAVHYGLESFRMEFRDDGDGFDPDGCFEGFGLIGIRERIENLSGMITLESEPGRGTRISFSLPVTPVSRPPSHEP